MMDPGATNAPVGIGCTAAGPAPARSASDPVLGSVIRVDVTGAQPKTTGLLAVGALPPRPLAFGGGCTVYVDLSLPLVLLGFTPKAAGRWSFATPIPNDAASIGALVMIQAVLGPANTPPLGLDMTRGVLLTLGR